MNYDGKLYELNKRLEDFMNDQKRRAFGDDELEMIDLNQIENEINQAEDSPSKNQKPELNTQNLIMNKIKTNQFV